MKRAPVMCKVHILATVLVATAMMLHRLTALKIQQKTDLRIFQGVDDVTKKYSYVVILQPFRFCTGSLITPEWVLTAAHCCDSVKPSHIQFGDLSIPLNATDSKREVNRSVSHPRYEYSPHPPTDIALLFVSPRVQLDRYGILSAVDYSTLLGLSVEYVGGGDTYKPKRSSRSNLKHYMRDLRRPLQIGQGVISPCVAESRGHICISPKCSIKQTAMPGDSGGPLLVDDLIVGVGKSGPREMFYEDTDRVYTPISPHQEWIRSVIIPKPI